DLTEFVRRLQTIAGLEVAFGEVVPRLGSLGLGRQELEAELLERGEGVREVPAVKPLLGPCELHLWTHRRCDRRRPCAPAGGRDDPANDPAVTHRPHGWLGGAVGASAKRKSTRLNSSHVAISY